MENATASSAICERWQLRQRRWQIGEREFPGYGFLWQPMRGREGGSEKGVEVAFIARSSFISLPLAVHMVGNSVRLEACLVMKTVYNQTSVLQPE